MIDKIKITPELMMCKCMISLRGSKYNRITLILYIKPKNLLLAVSNINAMVKFKTDADALANGKE